MLINSWHKSICYCSVILKLRFFVSLYSILDVNFLVNLLMQVLDETSYLFAQSLSSLGTPEFFRDNVLRILFEYQNRLNSEEDRKFDTTIAVTLIKEMSNL